MSFVDNYTITLPPNKLEYYQKWENNDVFKEIHVGFELEKENRLLKQVSGGNPLDKYNKVDINKVIGVGKYLDQLHDVGIYHGDIISGELDKKNTDELDKKYTGLKINVGNILKDDKGKITLIDFGPIDENEERDDKELMEIEKKMLKQVREEGVTETYSPKRIKPGQLSHKEQQARRKRDNYDDFMPGYDSDDSYGSIPSPPKKLKSSVVRGNMFDGMGGKKKRRRTKKKRKRKRKYTRRKKKRKRRRTKKKRRRRR